MTIQMFLWGGYNENNKNTILLFVYYVELDRFGLKYLVNLNLAAYIFNYMWLLFIHMP